ncbi:JNK-interacting protein 3 isoform X2 [Anopheles maculipalpis]|uniref:JNK-interacting protein 3 isoform X2 n=1 Tax=Anopheles maculipalpis TaxID=1496333 RepID=UPI002159A9B8|nr:JNK-interacting protein 3 isoform X2 [Anopheles maculipalpis]
MESNPGESSEVVYGTHEDSAMVMSEKVQSLAGSIYQEFERMIQRYDEDVVKTLMPLLVNVLECLDSAYQTNQEQDVELELLREDNEQLVTQYEREKNARKQSEQKLLETEDLAEQENKELASRLESLESIVRMLELKHKNSMDHASRLEERESELKKEYSKLHERYTELFKTHVDYMERTKLMMGNSTHSQAGSASERLDVSRSRLMPMMRSTGPVSYGFASLENSTMLDTETLCSEDDSGPDSGPPSLQNEIETKATEKVEEVDSATTTPADGMATSSTAKVLQSPSGGGVSGKTTTKKEQRSANTLYQELSFQDDNLESEENEITGAWVHPGDYASSANDNFFGMGKEVENLIMENNELLATKNALNIVKDDLIVKVDELTGEIEILREELNAVILARNKLKAKVTELEEELKKTKAQVKQASSSATDQEEEGDVPMAQRKRFTRVEMARVLMERNQYKERFMELQDAVRWTEMMRASRVENLDKKSKQGIWKFFSNLFSSNDRPTNESPGRLHQRYGGVSAQSQAHGAATLLPAMPEGRMLIGAGNSGGAGGGVGVGIGGLGVVGSSTALLRSGHASNILVLSKEPELTQSERAMQRRRDQYRQVRAHVQKEDGRLQAYGWSLPSLKPSNATGANGGIGGGGIGGVGRPTGSGVPVPVPVYCRPLAEASPHMKVWCASGVNLQGGYTKDGGCIVGAASIFYSKDTTTGGGGGAQITEITGDEATVEPKDLGELLERKLLALGGPNSLDADSELSSYVWICTSTHSASTVTVIDAKNPSEVLDSFPVCQNHLLCICTVRGALEMDYAMLENSEVTKSGKMLEKPGESPDDIGKVSYEKVVRTSAESAAATSADESKVTEQAQEAVPPSDTGPEQATEANNDRDLNHNSKLPSNETADSLNVDTKEIAIAVDGNDNTIDGETTSSPSRQQQSAAAIEESISSIGPTMWLGAQNGMLYVHSSVARWNVCLHKIKLPDSVLSIVHVESRVIVALANGTLAVFRRQVNGEWDLNSYHLLTLGSPKYSVRCLTIVGDKVWAAHRNKIHVIDPITLCILKSFEAHPRKESQIRQMATTGLGVWVSIRLDSTLRLFSAETYDHLEDIDIDPYVSKMLGTGKLGFSFVRITALLVSCNRLWIGTGNGVVISVPLTDASGASNTPYSPRFANAQLSFHGHRDAVKFFVSVPMNPPNQGLPTTSKDMLVISGGEGYIDFRLEEIVEDVCDAATHLLVWRVSSSYDDLSVCS